MIMFQIFFFSNSWSHWQMAIGSFEEGKEEDVQHSFWLCSKDLPQRQFTLFIQGALGQ